MKIDQTTLKAFTTEVTPECEELISSLRKGSSTTQFVTSLDGITEWCSTFGKIEMGRWTQVLNDCDDVLEEATSEHENKGMTIDCTDEFDHAVISVLRFTSLLFENSFSRSVYSSVDHLFKLLDSNKLFVVVQTLRLLLVISKSSRYITQHVKNIDKRLLYMKLTANTECWTTKLRTHKMSEYCSENPPSIDQSQISFRTTDGQSRIFRVDITLPRAESALSLRKMFEESGVQVEESEQILALTKLRMAYNFDTINGRAHCIMARLISISVLFYSRCLLDEWRINCFLHDDFIEQVCGLLQLDVPNYGVLMDAMKTEAMKTLASVVFLEKPRIIQLVVDCLGLNSYHGFTSSLIRTCVDKLKAGAIEHNAEYSVSFVTALFSLVYHIAGFDYGGESLISCSMIGSLLVVVKTYSLPDSQISFVTRAVRIIDILTGIDVAEFNANDGMNVVVNRFVHEVENCKKHNISAVETVVCHQQRIALMKSLLNFLKRAIADTNYTAQIRRIMEADLPRSIIYIIENPEYFGPSLLHCAIQLTTSFIYQEPAQLTFLQDNGLTEAMLNSLFNEKFPVSRDIVTGLPNICSALCLNERGLACFNDHKPFERIFRIIFSTKFITSLRKRKTEILEAATTLGTAFDELMRHQPTLRKDLLSAFAKVLDDILACGNSESSKCVIAWTIGKMTSPDDEFLRNSETPSAPTSDSSLNETIVPNMSVIFHHSPSEGSLGQCESSASNVKKTFSSNTQVPFRLCHEQDGVQTLPYGDYLGMIGAMVEAILTNRAAHENSAVMLECGIPSRLVSLLILERPYPTLFQSPFLHNLATIIRHLLCQTNKIDAFDALMQNIMTQLKRYQCVKNMDEFNRHRMFLVNRINALVFVACNFLKTALNNVHDNRALLLKYFGTTGLDIIMECFNVFRRLYSDIIYLNVQLPPTCSERTGGQVYSPESFLPFSRVASIAPAPLLSEEISVADPPSSTQKESTPTQSTKMKTMDLTHASIHRLQKQLSDIVTHLNKIFCSMVTRPRRGLEKSLFTHANDASNKLFQGMARVMEYDELLFQSKNWSCMYICHVISILKKLLFDEFHGTAVMLPFFYSTGCHQLFFALGQFIVDNESEMLVVMTTAWLGIIQRLVSVSHVNTLKSKSDLSRIHVEGFEAKKYLSICHQDSLMSLQKFFKRAIDPTKDKEKAHDLLEKILGAFQGLVRGIVQLHEIDKKEDDKQPSLDALLNEIDNDKVQRLVEMGFSQSDAVDALLIHTSVSDAADYLIGMTSSTSNNTASTNANIAIRRGIPSHLSSGTPVADRRFTVESFTPYQPGGADTLEQILQDLDAYEQGQGGPRVLGASSSMETSTDTNEPTDRMDTTEQQAGTSNLSAESTSSTSAAPSAALFKAEGILPYNKIMSDIQTMGFKECIGFICDNVVPDCITIVQRNPTLVYSVSEFFSVFMNESMASDWICNTFVKKLVDEQLNVQEKLSTQDCDSDTLKSAAMSFAALLHLFCLMWQTIENMKTSPLLNDDFINNIMQMLFVLDEKEPEWSNSLIAPILLCLDMCDRKKRSDARQKFFDENVEHVQWCYYVSDRYPSNQEWRDYSPVCSAKLNKAFRDGNQFARVTINEKNYLVDFVDMLQRPADSSASPHGGHLSPGPVYARAKLKSTFALEEFFKVIRCVPSVENELEFCGKMIRCLLGMLKKGQNSEVLQPLSITYSILSLLLRLLLTKGMTDVFVEAGGIGALLRMLCAERRRFLSTVSIMLLRTCLDDDEVTLDNSFSHIIRSVESGTISSLSDVSSRSWLAKTKKSQRDWRRVSRFLLPLAAFSAPVYHETMRRTLQLRNNEVELIPANEEETNESDKNKDKVEVPKVAACGPKSCKILNEMVIAIVDELFATDGLPANNQERVFNASHLLRLLAELLRSYAQTASIIVEMTRKDRSVISLIMELYIVQAIGAVEAASAAKAVLVNLLNAGGTITSRASEIIVNDTKTLLCSIITKHNELESTNKTETSVEKPAGETSTNTATEAESTAAKSNSKRNEGVVSLASLILLLRDYAQDNGNKNRDIKQTYSLIRHIHKKNLVVDFAKAIWYLPLREKQSSDAIHTILHLFECVAQDLIAINSVRSANATAATASATAAAAIAAATQTAAQVQARAAGGMTSASDASVGAVNDTPVTNIATTAGTDTTITTTGTNTAVTNSSNVQPDNSIGSQMDDTIATAPFALDTEMSDLNVSQVLANIARARNIDEEESDSNDDDSQPDEDGVQDNEENSTDSDNSSGGSDGEGNNTLHGDEADASAIYRHHSLGIVRTSTPISEDDIDHHDEDDEMDGIHDDRVIIGDEDVTQREEEDDDEDDEDGMDDDAMDDDEAEEDNFEFDDVINDILDVSLLPGDGGHSSGLNFTGTGNPRVHANVRVLLGNEFFPGNLSNGLVEFSSATGIGGLAELEMNLASALTGRLSARANNGNPLTFTAPISHHSLNPPYFASLFGMAAVEPDENDNNYHPLLRRPDTAPTRENNSPTAAPNTVNSAFMGNASEPFAALAEHHPGSTIQNLETPEQMEQFFRDMHTMNRVYFNGRRVPHAGLRRQNALRRWHPMPPTNANIVGPFSHVAFGRSDNRLNLFGASIFSDSVFRPQGFELSAERRFIQLLVPFFLDRVFEKMKLIDGSAMHYVSLIITSYLEKILVKEEEKPTPEQAIVPNETPVETAESEESHQMDTSTNACDEPTAHEGIELATETAEHLQITGSEVPPSAESSEDTRESEMSGIQTTETVTTATESNFTTQQQAESTETKVPSNETMEVDTTPVNQDTQPSTSHVSEPSTMDDFREILGDIEIPEGVDPAFLAALPEDIRQEVIRDHMVQQRAQRINRAQRTEAAASGGNGDNTEGEDVLDQEFLAALVPELQEEVLAQHEQRLARRRREQQAAESVAAATTTVATSNTGDNQAINAGDNRATDSSATASAASAAASNPVDVEAIFESLPPGLRAQVLADADDSVLQILPPNLLAEANRLRASFEQQVRFARMLDRRPTPRTEGGPLRQLLAAHVGSNAISQHPQIEQKGVQMFDKESLSTLLLLYFMDQEKTYLARLQKLLKSMCLHSSTCDQVIWSILSILNVLGNVIDDETISSNDSWLDSFYTQTALNQTEKALFVSPNGVKVHPLVRNMVCLRILDTLIMLSKAFPQHFLSNKLRHISAARRFDSVVDLNAFWNIAQETSRKSKENFKPTVKALTQFREIILPSLEKSPLAFILEYTDKDIVKNNTSLMDKCLKIMQIVTQSIPNDSQSKINDETSKWLTERLHVLADKILLSCCDEGLKDGRLFFIEVIRILPTLRSPIFEMLYETVCKQGENLQVDIKALLNELEEFKKSGKVDIREKVVTESEQATRSTTFAANFGIAGSSRDLSDPAKSQEIDLQLSTLKEFTKRNSQSKKFLKALETISFLRNQLKSLIERRRKTNASTGQSSLTAAAQPTNTAVLEDYTQQADASTSSNAPSTSGVTVAKTEASLLEDSNVKERYLSNMLDRLEPLWNSLSTCLEEMSRMLDSHAVLSLQQAAEGFFLAHAFAFNQKELESQQNLQLQPLHASSQGSVASSMTSSNLGVHVRIEEMNKYTQRMFYFAEKHRTVLNQILRGNTNNLMEDSAFAILTYFPKLLDFDVKRKYFYKEIRKLDDRSRHDDVALRIRRNHLFGDSFRELIRLKPSDWKARFYIIFEGEEGQDAGGLLREWYSIITREVFNPNYALFITAPGDRVTYMINKSSYINPEHLDYFKFIGRVIAKAIYDNKQLDCYFTRAFYKHILNVPVRYQDIESEDPSYFSSLEYLLKNPLEEVGVDLTFSVEVEEFGERSMRKLREDGDRIQVTDTNKEEYVQLVCQMKMTGSIRKQLDAFLEGFYQIIPKKLISIFNEQELELLLSGLPEIDIDDLCNNTDYKGYNRSSPQIQWFWRALRSFEQEDLAKFLQFVTGTSKVPLQGFSHLEGMNGVQKFTIHMDSRSNDRLPSAHTCFNQLDLPKYDNYEQLREMLLLAIRECSEGFAFA